MSRPILYKVEGSPPASAVRMLAEIIELELELEDIDFFNFGHKSLEYMKLNPMATVPTLRDGDFVIGESHAIMKYLLSKYGGDKEEVLYPSDLRTRALVDQCLFFDTGVFFASLKQVILPTIFEGLEEPTAKHKDGIEAAYGVVEAYLGDRQWLVGDGLTLADLSVGSTAAAVHSLHPLDSTRFPRVAIWKSLLEQEPSYTKIMGPAADIMRTIINSCQEKSRNKFLDEF